MRILNLNAWYIAVCTDSSPPLGTKISVSEHSSFSIIQKVFTLVHYHFRVTMLPTELIWQVKKLQLKKKKQFLIVNTSLDSFIEINGYDLL